MRKLPLFNHQPKGSDEVVIKEKVEISAKEIAQAYGNVEFAKEHNLTVSDILSHDILSVSPMFQGDLPFLTTKSKLMDELEPKLDTRTWNKNTEMDTHVVVDSMSRLRQTPFTGHVIIGDFLESCIKSSLSVSQRVQYLHIAKDSYIEYSLKESERMRRKNDTESLEIIGMTLDTPVPHIPGKFWASENNKRYIQQLVETC